MKLTIDLESRSTIDLKTHGMYVYADPKHTEIMCIAFKFMDYDPWIWVPNKFYEMLPEANGLPIATLSTLTNMIIQATEIEAHNAAFELTMWNNIMVPIYNVPRIPEAKLSCSAAKASSYNLPRALGNACSALGLSQQKDTSPLEPYLQPF